MSNIARFPSSPAYKILVGSDPSYSIAAGSIYRLFFDFWLW